MLRMKAVIHPDARLEVRGALGDPPHRVCADETLSRQRSESAKITQELWFRALLDDGAREVRFEREATG